MDNEQNTGQAQTIIVKSTKNVALATGLAFFFGPIGMCYATIKGAIIMFLVNFVVGGYHARIRSVSDVADLCGLGIPCGKKVQRKTSRRSPLTSFSFDCCANML